MKQICKTCKKEKDISCFYERPGPYITKSCKDCICERQKGYKQPRKKYSIEYRREKYRESKYSFSQKEHDKIFKEQNGKCAICRTPESDLNHILAVDHCHKTGKVRGLLCNSCNKGLGMFKDNTLILEDAIYYLILNK